MGIKERKERERQQRFISILEVARVQFEEKGFLNTTLQDVANRAEISVGLIYRYFESKEDIFASLALKGAKTFDADLDLVLKKTKSNKRKSNAKEFLFQIAEKFFDFYAIYGEYFDMLMYSYKGKKQIQIQENTITQLISVTLSSLDKLKNYILNNPQFRAETEEEALHVVLVLWGILLGCHKLFDRTGRGNLFSLNQAHFLQKTIEQITHGITHPYSK